MCAVHPPVVCAYDNVLVRGPKTASNHSKKLIGSEINYFTALGAHLEIIMRALLRLRNAHAASTVHNSSL